MHKTNLLPESREGELERVLKRVRSRGRVRQAVLGLMTYGLSSMYAHGAYAGGNPEDDTPSEKGKAKAEQTGGAGDASGDASGNGVLEAVETADEAAKKVSTVDALVDSRAILPITAGHDFTDRFGEACAQPENAGSEACGVRAKLLADGKEGFCEKHGAGNLPLFNPSTGNPNPGAASAGAGASALSCYFPIVNLGVVEAAVLSALKGSSIEGKYPSNAILGNVVQALSSSGAARILETGALVSMIRDGSLLGGTYGDRGPIYGNPAFTADVTPSLDAFAKRLAAQFSAVSGAAPNQSVVSHPVASASEQDSAASAAAAGSNKQDQHNENQSASRSFLVPLDVRILGSEGVMQYGVGSGILFSVNDNDSFALGPTVAFTYTRFDQRASTTNSKDVIIPNYIDGSTDLVARLQTDLHFRADPLFAANLGIRGYLPINDNGMFFEAAAVLPFTKSVFNFTGGKETLTANDPSVLPEGGDLRPITEFPDIKEYRPGVVFSLGGNIGPVQVFGTVQANKKSGFGFGNEVYTGFGVGVLLAPDNN